jgi:hypothetical protein
MKFILQLCFLTFCFSGRSQDILNHVVWMDDFRGVWDWTGQSLVETDDLGSILFGSTYLGHGTEFIEWRGDTLVKDFEPNSHKIVFLAKLDLDGNIQWHKIIEGLGDVILRDMVTDHQQNQIVLIESESGFEVFQQTFQSGFTLIKLDPTGQLLWTQHLKHGDRQLFTVGHLMSITCNDELILGGSIGQVPYDSVIVDIIGEDTLYGPDFKYDTLYFDGQYFPADTHNFFVARVGQDGRLQWLRSFEHPGGIELNALDASGPFDIALLGTFLHEDWPIHNTLLPIDTIDYLHKPNMFIMTLNNAGEIKWVRKYFSNTYPDHISRDYEGNLIVVGSFRRWTYSEIDTIGDGDAYSHPMLFKIDSLGNYVWGTHIADQPTNFPAVIQPNANGEIYHTGSLSNLIGPILNKFDASGSHLWTLNPVESSNRSDQDLDLDPFGFLVLSGFFSGEFILAGHSLEHTAYYCNYLIKLDSELDPQQPSLCEIVSGINHESLPGDQLLLSPNPSYDHILIESTHSDRNQGITIYDMNGRIMLTDILKEANTLNVNTSEWPSGIYAVRIESSSRQVVKTFVIVK